LIVDSGGTILIRFSFLLLGRHRLYIPRPAPEPFFYRFHLERRQLPTHALNLPGAAIVEELGGNRLLLHLSGAGTLEIGLEKRVEGELIGMEIWDTKRVSCPSHDPTPEIPSRSA
jgi:hypothetical protein